MTTSNTTLTGFAAIEYAEERGLTLSKYTDPTEEARDGLTVEEAREIAAEDPSLVYLAAAAAKARTRRYVVRETGYGCELTLLGDYGQDGDGDTDHEFWAPEAGGYVYETTHAAGTSGRQVCESLFGVGSTLMSSRGGLAEAIRRLARRHCDAIDRQE